MVPRHLDMILIALAGVAAGAINAVVGSGTLSRSRRWWRWAIRR